MNRPRTLTLGSPIYSPYSSSAQVSGVITWDLLTVLTACHLLSSTPVYALSLGPADRNITSSLCRKMVSSPDQRYERVQVIELRTSVIV